MRKIFATRMAAAALALASAMPATAQPADVPELLQHAREDDPFQPLLPLIGKTWRGTGSAGAGVEDVMRWDWAIGGHAVRVVHSVNRGAYGGETLIFPDRESGTLIFHYFTSGGFHTTGTMRSNGPGRIAIEETVHGAGPITKLRSSGELGADGVYRTRSSRLSEGKWVEGGGFDYRQDPDAELVLPVRKR